MKLVATTLFLAAVLSVSGQTILLEAESGTLVGTTVATNVTGYSGTGYVTGFDNPGDLVRWTFAGSNGFYRLEIGFRSPFGPKGFDATLNSATISGMFPQTNGFGSFDAGLVQLTNGNNTLEIGGGWNYYEIDRADLILTNTQPPLPVAGTLVDTQATYAAQVLMQDLASAYGKVTWSGQAEASEATNVFNLSGRKPIIVSGDFMDYSPSRIAFGANPGQLTESYIALEDQGHVLSMCWHWNAPTNLLDTPGHEWWRGFYTDSTTFDVAAALANTNSPEYALLVSDMDAIAAQLEKFASNNVPVLWRPLHEAEGGWFWWGAKGPEPFKQLWRLLYNRLTVHHNLHNLIWVLTSEAAAWYPGNDVVDILGVDGYPADRSDPLSWRWEALKARFDGQKLIALTEFGGVPDIEKMHQFGVCFSYFAPWTGSNGPTSMPTNTVVRIYQSSEVLTLDELNAVPPVFTQVVKVAGNNIRLSGQGRRGAAYALLTSSNATLPASGWTSAATGQLSGGVFTITNTINPNIPAEFWRLKLWP